MALSILIIISVLPKQPRFKFEFEKGHVWLHEDLISPYNFPIRKNMEEIKSDKESILNFVLPIYEINEKVFENQISQFRTDFEFKWKNTGLKNEKLKSQSFKIGFDILKRIYEKGVIGLNKKYQKGGDHYPISVLRNGIETQQSSASLYTQLTALEAAKNQLRQSKNVDTDFLLSIIKDRIEPNVIYNEPFTEKIEKQAVENISTTRGMVQKGELIIAKGNMINDETYQKIE